MEKYNGTFEQIDPTLIVLDHKYQRAEKWDLISKIARKPEWVAFGIVLCSKRTRSDGGALYYCLDGQQRLMGVLASDSPPATVPALWFPVQSVKEEARLFTIVNVQRRAVNALEKYKSHMTMEDPRYLQITGAVERAGFHIGTSQRDSTSNTISAIAGLHELYNRAGEDGVFLALSAVAEAWPEDKAGVSTLMLRGLADALNEHRPNGVLSYSKLAGGLSKTSPGRVLRKAEELRFEMGGSKRENVRRALRKLAKV